MNNKNNQYKIEFELLQLKYDEQNNELIEENKKLDEMKKEI